MTRAQNQNRTTEMKAVTDNPFASPSTDSQLASRNAVSLPFSQLLIGVLVAAATTSVLCLTMCPVCMIVGYFFFEIRPNISWASFMKSTTAGVLIGPLLWIILGGLPAVAAWCLRRSSSRHVLTIFSLLWLTMWLIAVSYIWSYVLIIQPAFETANSEELFRYEHMSVSDAVKRTLVTVLLLLLPSVCGTVAFSHWLARYERRIGQAS